MVWLSTMSMRQQRSAQGAQKLPTQIFPNVLDFMSAPTPHGNNVNNLKLSCRAVTRTWQLVTSAHYQLLASTKSVLIGHAA